MSCLYEAWKFKLRFILIGCIFFLYLGGWGGQVVLASFQNITTDYVNNKYGSDNDKNVYQIS